MSRKRFLPYALTAALTVASACSKDKATSTEPTGSTLTSVELNSMMEALSNLGIFFPGAVFAQPLTSRGLAAQQTGNIPVDETNSCTSGGTIRVQGNYTASASGSFSGTFTQTASNCKESSSDGTLFTFSTNPNLTVTFDGTVNQSTGAFNFTLHDTGNFNWSKPGKSGGCSMNINITLAVTSSGAETGNASGTVCGQAVNETL